MTGSLREHNKIGLFFFTVCRKKYILKWDGQIFSQRSFLEALNSQSKEFLSIAMNTIIFPTPN
jgi:hypothetical protein